MDYVIGLVAKALGQTLVSLSHNWPYLLASILIAGALKTFMDAEKAAAKLVRYRGVGVLAAVAAAVATPLCSCGTTAIVLGMMASTMPWAPIVAFMVASPLSSPEGLIYSAGFFGWPFALSYFAASIVLGLAGGGAAALLESRGFLRNQVRFSRPKTAAVWGQGFVAAPRLEALSPALTLEALSPDQRLEALSPALAAASPIAPSCACSAPRLGALSPALALEALSPDQRSPAPRLEALSPAQACGCHGSATPPSHPEATSSFAKALILGRETWGVARRILPMFVGFAFLGYLINGAIPSEWILALFGQGHAYSVPLAATIGLPLYINSEASMPLARGLLDSGMSQGAVMAFLIAGSGTSIGAITGALTIARWRVVGLVVALLWAGAIVAGWGFDLLRASGLA